MSYSYTTKRGHTYYLHKKIVMLSKKPQTIYFFARYISKTSIDEIPKGYTVGETERTHMPYLIKL
jgi:hypothetical protein